MLQIIKPVFQFLYFLFFLAVDVEQLHHFYFFFFDYSLIPFDHFDDDGLKDVHELCPVVLELLSQQIFV